MRGTLFLVVGPSGAGKDTLIEAAARLRPDLMVPRRVVTRAAGSVGEDFDAIDPDRFARDAAAGRFLLHWQAHGLGYGIPGAAGEALAAGRDVLANVSRRVVAAARADLQPCRVLLVTAPVAVLAERLAARGRETAADIAARLARADDTMPSGPDVTVIDNSGEMAPALSAFLAALQPVSA